MLRALTRPLAVFARIRPLVMWTHTGVTCGEPFGMIVGRWASAFLP